MEGFLGGGNLKARYVRKIKKNGEISFGISNGRGIFGGVSRIPSREYRAHHPVDHCYVLRDSV